MIYNSKTFLLKLRDLSGAFMIHLFPGDLLRVCVKERLHKQTSFPACVGVGVCLKQYNQERDSFSYCCFGMHELEIYLQ